MNTKSYLKLIIDNTLINKVNALLDKQKKLIRGKIALQNEQKEIKKLLQQYENNIISIENKLNTYRRKQHGKRDIEQIRNVRSSRNKTKKDND